MWNPVKLFILLERAFGGTLPADKAESSIVNAQLSQPGKLKVQFSLERAENLAANQGNIVSLAYRLGGFSI